MIETMIQDSMRYIEIKITIFQEIMIIKGRLETEAK